MATKRKSLADGSNSLAPAKKAKVVAADGAADKTKSKNVKSSTFEPVTRGPATGFSSVLTSARAETDFPRGGGTILTPLEVKEAHAEARQELFAENAAEKGEKSATRPTGAKKRKFQEKYNPLKEKASKSGKTGKTEDQVRIEHLNYKKCIPGTRMLAQIISVDALELIVSLPNQMLGHIPIFNVSAHLNAVLGQKATASNSSEDEEENSDEDEVRSIPTLKKMFAVGQILTVAVVEGKEAHLSRKSATGPRKADDSYRMSRRLQLSLDPSVVHRGMSKTDLVQSQTLAASVKSIEDNGYLLDLGIDGVTAFASFGEGKKAGKGKALSIAQSVQCQVIKLAANGRTCTVALLSPDGKCQKLTNPPTLTGILPGSIVQCLVTAVVPAGLTVKFLGLFDGTIDLNNVGDAREKDLETAFKIGKKITAKVLWTTPNSDSSTVGLTLSPHILNTENPSGNLEDAFPIGTILEAVHVTRVEPDFGISCEIRGSSGTDKPVQAFCHFSKVGDEHIQSLHGNASSLSIGSVHRARVIGFSAMDQIVQLSFQPSVLASKFITVADAQLGSVVKGTVTSLTASAMFVNIGGSIDAVVWPAHYSDIRLKHPERKFKPGVAVKGRIFSIDPEKRRINLTLKKTIVNSELPALEKIDNPIFGTDVDAVIARITEKALLVDLCGGHRALVPIAEASNEYIRELGQQFTIGQAVKVRVTALNDDQRLVVSIRRALGAGVDTSADLTHESGTVQAITDSHIVIKLDSGSEGTIELENIAKLRKVSIQDAKELYSKGDKIATLAVKRRNGQVMHVSFAKHEKGKQAAQADDNPKTFDAVQVGQTLVGTVKARNALSWTVQIARGLKGRLHVTDVADDYDEVDVEKFEVESKVTCRVIGLDSERKFVDLSIRPSALTTSDDAQVKDPVISGLDDLTDLPTSGATIRGFVKDVTEKGLFVSLGRDLDARVQITNLFDDFVKEWRPKFKQAQLVSGKILSVDATKYQIEMSFRTRAKKQAKPSTDPWSALATDQQVECTVKREESFGFFLRINDTSISGLCHKSEILDGDSKGWSKALAVGQEVKAVITEVDKEKRRISFSVKPSRIAPEASEKEDSDDEMQDDADADSDDEENTQMLELDGASDEDGHASDEEMLLDGNTQTQAQPVAATAEKREPAESDVAEFERLLLGSPNSSLLWIQFMSYYLSLGQIPAARVLARRALKTIDFRQQEEKNNVWIAMLNLENSYGTEDSLDDIFSEAVHANNGKHMYLRLLEILQQPGKNEKGNEVMEQACAKYPQSSKVWTTAANHLYAQKKTEEARDLLPRSLKTLPARKHVKTISKFAQSEFRLGDAERGRTLFEGILTSHPRHLDILAVYIDMEAKQNDIVRARALYNRAVNMKLSSKKAKWLFKRFLAFEKTNDNEEGVELVKAMAQAWVAEHGKQGET